MTHRKRRPQAPPTRESGAQLPGTPSLTELEKFTYAGLQQWRKGWAWHRDLYSELYFGTEHQRAQYSSAMAHALLKNAAPPLRLQQWARIIDYQYGLAPLSIAGSLSTEGGRFNIGRRLNPSVFAPFGALYVADSHDTAYAEKFGMRRDETRGGLTADDLALRGPSSYSFVAIDGYIEQCFDVSNRDALQDFVRIIAKFKMPQRALQIARAIKKVPPAMIRSTKMLQDQLLHPNWNTLPTHFSLPSNSQIFGRLLHAAGFHGALYTSVRYPGRRCLALFPENWRGSKSEIFVVDKAPPETRLGRLDGVTTVFE